MKLKDRLIKLHACEAAVIWVGDRDLKTAWADCERADWMLWFAVGVKVDRRKIVKAACECARRGLKYVPAGEDRPRLAIEAAERWAKNPTRKNKAAAAAAYAAAAYAAAAYAAAAYAIDEDGVAAVNAAVNAVNAAAAAAHAAATYAAAYAYAAAIDEDGVAAELKIMADIVRKHISVRMLK